MQRNISRRLLKEIAIYYQNKKFRRFGGEDKKQHISSKVNLNLIDGQ
jgi:hypothetical protein